MASLRRGDCLIKCLFSFNTKEYKLPKGVTFEYETGEKPKDLCKSKEQKERGDNLSELFHK